MSRSQSFSVEKSTENTKDHNMRKKIPRYLIDENAINTYVEFINKNEFLEASKIQYKETVKQKMQQKQIDNFYNEAVINLEQHHTVDDVVKLFGDLNEEYGGHSLINVAIHRDEGHFEKDGIEYYPTEHILKKNDDEWYIVPLTKFLEFV